MSESPCGEMELDGVGPGVALGAMRRDDESDCLAEPSHAKCSGQEERTVVQFAGFHLRGRAARRVITRQKICAIEITVRLGASNQESVGG